MGVQIGPYRPLDETGWLRCRVLAFLDSAYFENVRSSKETYENSSIQMVAEVNGLIVGLLDIKNEQDRDNVAFDCDEDPRDDLGAAIHHVAIHPDFRRRGIAGQLLETALDELRKNRIGLLEAWTRDERPICRWYESKGFRCLHSYLHAYVDGSREVKGTITSTMSGLYPCHTFAHYIGGESDVVRKCFKRVHDCRLYRRSV